LYSSPSTNDRKSRRMGKACNAYGRHEFWSENLKRRDHSENISVDLIETGCESEEMDSFDSDYGPMAGFCGYDNEPLSSTKERTFLTS
jgi:hypothetical protein